MIPRLLLAFFLLPVACSPSHDDVAGPASLVVRDATNDLEHTTVSAVLNTPHAANTSVVWCATMQLAWDQFPGVLGAPLTLQGDPPLALELNASPFPKDALDDASYVAIAGRMPGALDTIKAELARKFKGAANPSQLPTKDAAVIVAYACLFKNLQFETPLTRLKGGQNFWCSDGSCFIVEMFGINKKDTRDWDQCAAQVAIWRDNAENDFVIELKTKEAEDRLLIARLPPGATLKDTAAAAMTAAGGPSPRPALTKGERVAIPVLNFDITRAYDEVVGLPVTTPGISKLFLSYARQNIRFRLDEKGAVLKSEGGWGVKSAAPRRGPRSFVCEGPFAIVMARKGAAVPYFVAWIDNAEILVPHK